MPMDDKKIEKKIVKSIQKRFNHVKSSYQMYANNPYVSEYVHRFRVDMRKMRALLNFIKPILEEGVYEELNHTLRDLGKRLSPIRDLDTLIEECSIVANEEPELIHNYAAVFRFLEKERYKLVGKQSTKKAFKKFEEVLKQTGEILEDLSFDLEATNAENVDGFVEERYAHKTNKLNKEYQKLDHTDYEKIHEVRKQAKKVRYTSVGFKKILKEYESKQIKKQAKKVQKELGELTDKHVMVELLNEYKGKTDNKKIQESFQVLIDYYK